MSTRSWIPGPDVVRGAVPALAFLTTVATASVVYLLLDPFPIGKDWLYNSVAIASALAVLVGVHRHRPIHRWPWLLLALGTGLFATGDVAWAILELVGELPFPSVADVAYVAGYPALMLAFLLIIGVRVADGDRSGLLDAAILATAVGLIGWITLLRPVLDVPGDPIALAIGVSYPLGDLVIIGVAIGMLSTPGPRGLSFALLVGSLGIQFLGDMIYAIQVAEESFVDGGLLDLTWFAAYAMMGAAALVPSMRLVAEPNPVPIAWLSPLRLGFMTLAMLTGPALLLFHQDRDLPLLVAGTAILSLLVVGRLAVVVRALAQDNTARRSLEDELSYRATHDPLTGLANRRHFLERVEAAVAAAADGESPLSVLFLDLDDFKGINDTLGHATGDALLVTIGRRIRGHLRKGDLAARMGGDEFGILIGADEDVGVRVAQRVLDGFAEPVVVGGRSVIARGSIGVAQARPGMAAEELLANADVAMYKAKAMGKGTVCAYAPALRDDVVNRMQLEADLRTAIARDELDLEYQPIVELATGRTVGVEALVRWTHPTRGQLAPSVFLPLADATGLGAALGTWVLDTACAQVALWRGTFDPRLGLAVNLAPRQLAGADLVAVVFGAAQRAGLPLDALIVDVTEGALLLEAPEVAANLAALRALGTRVAIDDFGTGYSSLGYLGRLPVDILKIDRAFVARLGQDDDHGLAAIVVSLGTTLGLETIAEGIERPEQLDAVLRLGCRLGQGYHLAPPMTPAALEAEAARAAAPDPHGRSVVRPPLAFQPGA